MTKARTLADFISDGSPLADGTISVAEVVGAAPLASPTFSGTTSGTFSGPLAGAVTGNVTGDLTGNVTGALNATVNIKTTDFFGEGIGLGIDADRKVRFYNDQGASTKMYWNASTVTQKFENNSKIAFGSNQELQIYYDGVSTTNKLVGDLTQTGRLTTDAADLAAIAKSITDTAVDVFVYDTSKDSDGGAWRKRTQHTSWYNEAASATRGSRKEFPSVAVIVAESDQVTIYDGDDPDLPMWMVFNNGGGSVSVMLAYEDGNSSVSMLNGTLVVGHDVANNGISKINFITEVAFRHRDGSTSYTCNHNGIVERNANVGVTLTSDGALVNDVVNDVAMTVLPNAPIDAATGLPVPTIAVATDGGVSVIKDDGTVVDWYRSSGTEYSHQVAFDENDSLYVTWGTNNGQERHLGYLDVIPSSDDTQMTNDYYNSYDGVGSQAFGSSGQGILSNNARAFAAKTGRQRLFLLDHNRTNTDTSSVCDITSTYNTGWMNGNIKLATLSDTDTANVTGAELVTNGTFASNTTGWTAANSATVTHQSGRMRIAGNVGTANQAITTVVGKSYTVSADLFNGTSSSSAIYVSTTASSAQSFTSFANPNKSVTFTANATTTYIIARVNAATNTYIEVDNVSVRLAEEDRSVNNNGLQVFGTVTKTAVATGADLVGYSGFSGSNYLQQPVNTDLQFGTNDWAYMGWFKTTQTNVEVFYFYGQYTTGWVGGGQHRARLSSGNMNFGVTDDNWSTSDSITSSGTYNDGNWHHYAALRRGGGIELYADGVSVGSFTLSNAVGSLSNTGATVRYGLRQDNTTPFEGSLALARISATAPSPEQIAKIYNDEKHLFQAGAQATLYGSSATADAVTALAYDDTTELLHVGTSAGRSVFQGLRRVDNTTDAITAAISASNGLVAEE